MLRRATGGPLTLTGATAIVAFALAKVQGAHGGARKKREKERGDADGDQPAPVEGGPGDDRRRHKQEPESPAAQNQTAARRTGFAR
jgi:hypothetical protein